MGGSQVAGGLGVFRLVGSAKIEGQPYPWSVIAKVVSGSGVSGDANPSAWNYWKREILAYRSDLFNELSGNLVAPKCYGVTEHPNDEWRIWLEDILETPKTWTLERHGIAARHLGQFNGAYLTSRNLPSDQPWMYHGRARDWIKNCASMNEGFQKYVLTDAGRLWLTKDSVERIGKLIAIHPSLIKMLDRLPLCLCHHDAFRRNLIARDSENVSQTVAIDWSMIGYGRIGEEAGITTAVALSFLEVAGDHAKEMDKITFESYVDGLRDAGWQGDVRLARFGYTTAAALATGVAWPIFMSDVLSTDEGIRFGESSIGHTLNDILEQWAISTISV